MRSTILASLVILMTSLIGATAQEGYKAPGHDEFHHWYKAIQQQLNVSGCCDDLNNDCGPVSQYKFDNGSLYVVLEDGNWHKFTGTKIFYVDTPDERAHICRKPKWDNPNEFYFYCAFLPNGFS